MNELNQPTSRRSLLQKSVLFVAGALGLELGPPEAQAAAPPPTPAGGQTLTLYSAGLHTHRPGQQPGKLPSRNGRLNRHGDLLANPAGARVGEFTATAFGPEGSFAAATPAAFNFELQTLQLRDGALFGIGSGSEEQRVHAIVGGTGRFAGAKGSYVIRPSAHSAHDRAVEFVISLLT